MTGQFTLGPDDTDRVAVSPGQGCGEIEQQTRPDRGNPRRGSQTRPRLVRVVIHSGYASEQDWLRTDHAFGRHRALAQETPADRFNVVPIRANIMTYWQNDMTANDAGAGEACLSTNGRRLSYCLVVA